MTTSGIRFNPDLGVSSFSLTTTATRTVQTPPQTSSGPSVSGLLVDNVSDTETDLVENFSAESKRITSNATFTSAATDANWTSSNRLDDTSAIAGYLNGLQITNGTLLYPTRDYSGISNGPASNANYSGGACTGARYLYRVFKPSSGSFSNFTMTFQGSGTFIAESTSFTNSTNQIKFSFIAPTQTAWMDAYNDFATDTWTPDGAGGRNSGAGAGRAMNTTWGLTMGTKSTANSGNRIFVRISVPQGWTGNITNMTWVFSS